MVDYAVAQKIVELHVKQKESIHRVYSQVPSMLVLYSICVWFGRCCNLVMLLLGPWVWQCCVCVRTCVCVCGSAVCVRTRVCTYVYLVCLCTSVSL